MAVDILILCLIFCFGTVMKYHGVPSEEELGLKQQTKNFAPQIQKEIRKGHT